MTVIIPDLLCIFLLRDREKYLLNLLMIGMPWEGKGFEVKLYQRKCVIYYPKK
jgi:hypothetical protein